MRNGKYELVIAPEEYPGKKYRERYCYEHHLIWWQAGFRLPVDGEVIHHINGKHRDNKLKNLELLSVAEHNRKHGSGVTLLDLTCDFCKRKFQRRLGQEKDKKGYKNTYCSRSCLYSSLRNSAHP